MKAAPNLVTPLPTTPLSTNFPQFNPQAWSVPTVSVPQMPPAVVPSPDIKIELDNADLWQKFHQHTTEMIVTKSGRRMFPTLRYKVTGLDPNGTYAVFLELTPADDCRYKFQNGRWVVAGRADPPAMSPGCARPRMYAHPDSPAPGRIWMRQPISFHRIKLTNNFMDPQGHVLLNSMHKYQPRLYLMRLHDYFPSVPQLVASASFPETSFIAVTAYQNDRVIQLKIDHNPFAKGFRESGLHNEKKRPASADSSEHDIDTKEPIQKRQCPDLSSENQCIKEEPLKHLSVSIPTTSIDPVQQTQTVTSSPSSIVTPAEPTSTNTVVLSSPPAATTTLSPIKPPQPMASIWPNFHHGLLPSNFPGLLPGWPTFGLSPSLNSGFFMPGLASPFLHPNYAPSLFQSNPLLTTTMYHH